MQEFRGIAAAIAQPATAEGLQQLSRYEIALTSYNTDVPRIVYRNSYNDQDIIEAVYRWDTRSYQEIFETGFTPRPPGTTPLNHYYHLVPFVNGAGTPADPPYESSVFVSTTRSTSWRPRVTVDIILYRYEIFDPGGIDAVITLGNLNNFENQQEISFAGGISPQFIRIARGYAVVVEPRTQFPIYVALNNNLYGNYGFNPNPDSDGWTPLQFLYRLRNPVCPAGGDVIIWYPENDEDQG